MREKVFKKGDVIFSQGDRGEYFYRIVEGCVGIYAHYGEEGELKLTELTKDQYFGEMAVIEMYPRSATAIALSDDTKVLEVAGDEIKEFLAADPDQINALMKHLSDRLRNLTKDYNDVTEVIGELRKGQPEQRSEGLLEMIRRHVAAYRANKASLAESADTFNEMNAESHGTAWKDRVQMYPKGTVICREGEKIHCMYDLQYGTVGIYTGYGTDREQKLAELFPNSFFGELGMFTDEPRSATVVALEDASVEVIYKDDLAGLLEKNPPKLEMILRNLSYRLRYRTNRYLEACALVSELMDDEEKNGGMSPELAEKIAAFKPRLYS
jgi:CRP-like cAMP-binding protein